MRIIIDMCTERTDKRSHQDEYVITFFFFLQHCLLISGKCLHFKHLELKLIGLIYAVFLPAGSGHALLISLSLSLNRT